MGIFDIDSVTNTDLTGTLTLTSVNEGDTEITWYIPRWSKWHGIYREIPEISATIDKVSFWTAGKGIKAKEKSRQDQLDKIRGFGKDTIRDIAINLMRTSTINGDAIAEISKDSRGALKNLKPLNPGTIRVESNNKGILTGFSQITIKENGNIKNGDDHIVLHHWEPEELFYLPWNRIADEIHGISTIEKLEPIILKRKRAQEIINTLYERLIYPIRVIEADTDDETKLAEVKTKYQSMIDKKEIMVVPKGSMAFTSSEIKTAIQDLLEWPK